MPWPQGTITPSVSKHSTKFVMSEWGWENNLTQQWGPFFHMQVFDFDLI